MTPTLIACRCPTCTEDLQIVDDTITCPNGCADAHEGAGIDPLTIRRRETTPRSYAVRACIDCTQDFTPTGPRSERCASCKQRRLEATTHPEPKRS